jgi:hypothetical protein
MSGIPFRVDGKGRVLVSWMSRNKAYWSISDAGATRFAPPVATPDRGKQEEAFPAALANGKGEVLLVWLKGRQVAWAIYLMDGTFTGRRGIAGEQAGDSKPTAFVGADDTFYIVF